MTSIYDVGPTTRGPGVPITRSGVNELVFEWDGFKHKVHKADAVPPMVVDGVGPERYSIPQDRMIGMSETRVETPSKKLIGGSYRIVNTPLRENRPDGPRWKVGNTFDHRGHSSIHKDETEQKMVGSQMRPIVKNPEPDRVWDSTGRSIYSGPECMGSTRGQSIYRGTGPLGDTIKSGSAHYKQMTALNHSEYEALTKGLQRKNWQRSVNHMHDAAGRRLEAETRRINEQASRHSQRLESMRRGSGLDGLCK